MVGCGRVGSQLANMLSDNGSNVCVIDRSADDVEVVRHDTVLHPGDKAVVVADTEALDRVRALFKGL